MIHLVSSWSKEVQSIPEDYVLAPERRPTDLTTVCNDILVVDLQNDRSEVIQQILKALQGIGICQVINHGISEKMMTDMMALFDEFFSMKREGKPGVHSENYGKGCRLYTSGPFYEKEDVHMWKDTLHHACYPLEDHSPSWPDKPARYREEMGRYTVEVRKLAIKILDLIGEGLGLDAGYYDELIQAQNMLINHYPTCPDPSLTMGLAGHHDTDLLTLLQQDHYGLQIQKDGKWMGVAPIPNAFVVNLGCLFQIVSNGMLKSVEHRVVTNSSIDRKSIATFFGPNKGLPVVIQPAKELITPSNPQMFKSCLYGDFTANFYNFMSKPTPRVGTPFDAYRL